MCIRDSGDADETVSYGAALATAAAIGPPWGLITLVGGEHIPPYIQGLDVYKRQAPGR